MTLKIGIIGVGAMANYHIEGFRKAGAEVTALADKHSATLKAAGAKFGIPRLYGSLEEMLKEARDIDAVSVITPNKYHCPLVLEALKGGKHVFCEKPPALNAGETEQMAREAEKQRRTLMFNFNNRARPESVAVKKYIDAGMVGRINSAQALWIRRTGIPGFGGWFTTKAISGGGPTIDLLHMMDLALYFMDFPEPEQILAQTFNDFITNKEFKGPWGILDNPSGSTDVESSCHGFIRFAGGQVLFVRSSWAEMNRREEVSVTFQGQKAGGAIQRLFGTDGIDTTATDTCELFIQEFGHSANRSLVVPKDSTMGRVDSAAGFVHALEGRAEPLNTPDQAIKLMRIIDAMFRSAETGKAVAL